MLNRTFWASTIGVVILSIAVLFILPIQSQTALIEDAKASTRTENHGYEIIGDSKFYWNTTEDKYLDGNSIASFKRVGSALEVKTQINRS